MAEPSQLPGSSPEETGGTETEPLAVLEKQDYLKILRSAETKSKARIFQEAQGDFACFARAVVKDEKDRTRINLAPHHLEWIDHMGRCMAEGSFCGILAPPGSGKSQLFSVAFPLWALGNNTSLRVAVACSDRALAKKRVRPAKDYLQYDSDYKVIFPNVLPDNPSKWTEAEFMVRRPPGIKDPSYIGTGITHPPQGSRIDILIGDDVTTYDNTMSQPLMRRKVIDLWENGFDTRIDPQSFVLYIGGIIHNQDLSARLMEDPRFWFIKQSVSEDFTHLVQEDMRTGELKKLPLWERAWTTDWLRAKYEANPRAFQRAYRHIGYSDEERTFREAAVRAAVTSPLSLPPDAPRFIGVDLAGKQRKGTVILTVALAQGRRHVLEVQRGGWSSTETAAHIVAAAERHRPEVIVVENNAYQQALIDWLNVTAKTALTIVPFTTGKQKADEALGLPALAAEFDSGQWRIHAQEGHGPASGCGCGVCTLIAELTEHPFGNADTVMAAWFARYAVVRYGGAPVMSLTHGENALARGVRRLGAKRESRLSRFRKDRKL